jgi:hypothetical protein
MAKIWDLWMQCYTQQEIAEIVDVTQKTVSNVIDSQKSKHLEMTKTPPESLQYDTLWQFQKNDDRYGMKYPGRIPGQIIDMQKGDFRPTSVSKKWGAQQKLLDDVTALTYISSSIISCIHDSMYQEHVL